jgi:hypothetical protein
MGLNLLFVPKNLMRFDNINLIKSQLLKTRIIPFVINNYLQNIKNKIFINNFYIETSY